MTRRIRLNNHNVSQFPVEEAEHTVWDTHMAGLGVRIRPTGHRTFVCLAHRKGLSKRHTLGPVNLMSIEQARAMCLDIHGDRQTGLNQTRDTTLVTRFRDFVATTWNAECYERYKPSSRRSADSMLRNQLLPAFGDMPLDRIGRRAVCRWFDLYSISAPGNANATLGLLCQIMNRAMVHGHVRANPASGIRRNPGRKHTRFLSRDEIARMHAELERCVAERPSCKVQADIIRLLYFTGCRRGEILNLRWTEVGEDVLDLADSKTGPRRVYLNSAARAIIERQSKNGSSFVFPSSRDPSRPLSRNLGLWTRIRTRAGIEDVRLHDLRHNLASHAAMQGVPLPTVAKLLGHRQVSMTLRYAHVHDKEVEAAAERIGAIIADIWGLSGS